MEKIIQRSILLSFLLVLFNCQKEDDAITQDVKQNNSNFEFATIPFKVLENDKSLTTILEKQSAKQIEAKTSKTIYNEQYNFTVNTDYAKLIENNGLKRYTFGVTRTEDNGLLENLLLKEQTDGTYKVYLIQYDITTQERNTLANQEMIDVENKISYVLLEDISSSIFDKVNATVETCTVYSYVWTSSNTCGAGGNHTYQDGGYSSTNPNGCHAWGNPDYMATSGGWVLVTGVGDCTDGSSAGYEPGDTNTTSTNSNNGYSNNSGGYDSDGTGDGNTPPDTAVVICTDCPPVEEECSSNEALNSLTSSLGLDSALVTCLSDEEKCGAVGELEQFTIQNPSNSSFAISAAQAICEGYEVDFSRKIIYTINKPCQKELVKELMQLTTSYTTLINSTFGVSENVNVKFWNGNIQGGANASTNPFFSGSQSDFTINIGLDDAFLDTATDLSIIAVVLHELAHAYFISLYLEGNLEATNSDYSTLLNAFIAFYENATQDTYNTTDNEIHNAMNDFINEIANTIYNYSQNNSIEGITPEYCISLTWGTMLGTNLINEMLNADEQALANNIMLTEQNNNEYDTAFPVKGTPCQ